MEAKRSVGIAVVLSGMRISSGSEVKGRGGNCNGGATSRSAIGFTSTDFRTFGQGPGCWEWVSHAVALAGVPIMCADRTAWESAAGLRGGTAYSRKPAFQVPTGLLTVLSDCNPRYWRGRFLNCEYCASASRIGMVVSQRW